MAEVYVFATTRAYPEPPPGLAPASELGLTMTMTMTFDGVTYDEALLDTTTMEVVGVARRP